MPIEFQAINTAIGWCAIAGRGDQVCAVTMGHRSTDNAGRSIEKTVGADIRRSAWNRSLAERMIAALEGEPDEFRDVGIDLSHLTPFARRVAAACRRIGWGQTRSYGELAAVAGFPGAARAVGHVMATNRTPLLVPCHRVVASGGRLGGFSAPQGAKLKRRLLDLERAIVGSS
jgi:methylated-DNA-[protein]-cysteine S-methyltransferase